MLERAPLERIAGPGRPWGASGGRCARRCLPARAEGLEPRRMLSVAIGPDGWTVVTPPADARVVYVSSSAGNDANDGGEPASPVRTLAKGASLLRDGRGDELLLRCGDTWHEALGQWTRSGRSRDEPLLIGQYGAGPRPVVATGTGTAFTAGAAAPVHDVALVGIDFWADGRDPSVVGFHSDGVPNGIVLRDNVAGVLIEDCVVRDYGVNIDAQRNAGSISDVSIRRSVVIDAYSTDGSTPQGLYADGVNHLTLDGNVFDHNGWRTAFPARPAPPSATTSTSPPTATRSPPAGTSSRTPPDTGCRPGRAVRSRTTCSWTTRPACRSGS